MRRLPEDRSHWSRFDDSSRVHHRDAVRGFGDDAEIVCDQQQREIERQLLNFMSPEAIEILARVTAHVMARDPRQFPHLANLFKHVLDREYTYLREGVS